MFFRLESLLICRMSESVMGVWAIPPPDFADRRIELLASRWVLQRGERPLVRQLLNSLDSVAAHDRERRSHLNPLLVPPPPELFQIPTS